MSVVESRIEMKPIGDLFKATAKELEEMDPVEAVILDVLDKNTIAHEIKVKNVSTSKDN